MTDTNSGAREAVARAIYEQAVVSHFPNARPWDLLEEGVRQSWYPRVDVMLAALAPIIAAEIRAEAQRQHDNWDDPTSAYWCPARLGITAMSDAAETIASRICGGGEDR
jgi:hypothetical protein